MRDPDGAPPQPGYALDEISLRARDARRGSALFRAHANRTAARPAWDFNHVIAYGQPMASGGGALPPLSVTQRHDSLMMGDTVHGANGAGPDFEVAGDPGFRPLVASAAGGETVLEGALDFWRSRQLDSGAGRYPGRLVATATGVSDHSIEQLSSGQGPFEQTRQAARLARRLAGEAGGTYGIVALLWLQGGRNTVGDGTQERRDYFDLTQVLQADFNREIVQGVAGQEAMPAVFTHQAGGMHVRDAANMSIPMAQLDCAYALPDWFMVGPAYPVMPGSGHPDPNGQRWLGQQFGKVMHRVLDLGEGWKPVHPLRATLRGNQVLVDFHVPYPPLVFAPCPLGPPPANLADGGFRVTDEDGDVPVLAAAVVEEVSVLLVLARPPGAGPVLWYADETRHGGYGNLRDSDPTLASQAFALQEQPQQGPPADGSDLVGKPYPLWNWCIAFRTALEPDPVALMDPAPVAQPEMPGSVETALEPVSSGPVPDAPAARHGDGAGAEPLAPTPPLAEPPAPGVEASESAAWQVLRGQAPAPPAPTPTAAPESGFVPWLKGLFRRT